MNLEHLKQRSFAPAEQRWNWKDCALYAMGIGCGTDPLDERELERRSVAHPCILGPSRLLSRVDRFELVMGFDELCP